MIKLLKYIVAVVMLVNGSISFSRGADRVVAVYAQCNITANYRIGWKNGWLGSESTTYDGNFILNQKGTAWRTDLAGVGVFITAAHNIYLKGLGKDQVWQKINSIVQKDCWLDELTKWNNNTTQVIVGDFSRSPGQIAWPNHGGDSNELDVVVLYMTDGDVLSSAESTPLANKAPTEGEAVTIWGLPGTHKAQVMKDYIVSAVDSQSSYCLLNKPVEDGFSGGVVMDKDGKNAYGVIAGNTNDGKQTKVYLVTEELLSKAKPKPAAEVLTPQ